MSDRERNRMPAVHPRLNDQVHYVSYGTPGGEFASQCRAATVTAAGAWLPTEVEITAPGQRTVHQRWDPLAAGLFVMNPTGLFLNPEVQQDPDGKPGTWHFASWCPHRG